MALTETGAFHIERVRLNRPPLVALHRACQETAQLHRQLAAHRKSGHDCKSELPPWRRNLRKFCYSSPAY